MVHIHAEGPAFFAWLPKMFGKRVVVTVHGIDWQREKWQSGLGSKFIFIGELLEQGKMSVKVLRTNDTWYGMTYHEDVAAVKDSFKKMLENGVYKADLFSDF